MYFRFIIILLVFFSSGLIAQSPEKTSAVLSCVSVVNNDQVELSWYRSNGDYAFWFDEFIEYEVWRADALEGPYAIVTVITDTTQVSYIDITADAINSEKYYYIKKNYNFVGSPEPSDTTASINLVRIPTNNKSVQLEWNTNHITSGMSDPTGDYVLQKSVSAAPWVEVARGGLDFDEYYEDINDCHGPGDYIKIRYRIIVDHPTMDGTLVDCTASSNIIKGDFVDLNPPDTPVMETVSVNYGSGRAEVFWYPSLADDIGGYHILPTYTGAGFVATTTTSTQNSISVPITALDNPFQGSLGYSVLPFDNCSYPIPDGSGGTVFVVNNGTPSEPAYTIFLVGEYDVCSKSVTLTWTPYTSWPAGVDHYEILLSQNVGPLQNIAIVNADQNSIVIPDLLGNQEYSFVVNAICNDNTVTPSMSNRVIFQTLYPAVAVDYQIANVSVVNENQVEVILKIDQSVQGAKYRLEKLSKYTNDYLGLVTYPQAAADVNGIIEYNDYNVNNSERIYSYRLTAIDSCNNDVSTTVVSSTIHLDVFPNIGTVSNDVNWNSYDSWSDGVQEYNVYFSNTRNMDAAPKYILGAADYFVNDDITEYIYSETNFCYRVEAIENAALGYTSKSNIMCVNQDPTFFLPNAIMINGENPVFKPRGTFLQFDSFDMEIYNRWGQLLYKTSDFEQGWDGTYNGNYVREGAYSFFIRYRNGNGTERYHAGVLTVLRP